MITVLASLSFAEPWVLLGLLVIPCIWILLRAIPPAPLRLIFPAVVLLLGLKDKTQTNDRTPWWLLLLRSLALASLIIGMAGPGLNRQGFSPTNPDILIVVDGSWAAGQAWSKVPEQVEVEISRAMQRGVKVAFLDLTNPSEIAFHPAALYEGSARGLEPQPFDPN